MNIETFAGSSPPFLPEQFFAGGLEGWGILETPFGGLRKRYTVQGRGVWEPIAGIVSFSEVWRFDNGRTDTLDWRIRKLAPGSYSGVEARLEGEAKGKQAGAAFHWTYTRDTPQDDGSSMSLAFNDWFYMIDERVAIVRATAKRLAVPVALVHATYRRT